jgi:hypothetical protein
LLTQVKSACRDVIERALARHPELALDTRMATDVGTLRPAPELGVAGFQITAWLTPLETAAHPAIVPASVAGAGMDSVRLSASPARI